MEDQETLNEEPSQHQNSPRGSQGTGVSDALQGCGCLTEGCLGVAALTSAMAVVGVSLLKLLF